MNTLLSSGDILNSRYRILHRLGHGNFGRTYLAQDINRFNEHCVLKEFAPQLQDAVDLEKARELFEREAGVLYRLQHPQIPKFRELFRHRQENQERLLLVQDYVEGQTYHTLFNRRAEQGEKFNEVEIIELLEQILPVLEYIHSMGVIHRDISPDNLILQAENALPMLIDFGSIKEVEKKAQSQLNKATSPTETLTLMGTIIGKSRYAPPEQIERGMVFAHSDLYALAATSVVLLTGKKPQKLIDSSNYHWNWQQEVSLSLRLTSVLTTMLSANPSDRFGNATEVIKALQDITIPTPTPTVKRTAFVSNAIESIKQYPINKIQKTRFLVFLQLLFITIISATTFGSLLWLKSQASNIVSPLVFRSHNSLLQKRFSQGEKVLISQTTTPIKELAVAAFAEGNYDEAVSLFSASLNTLANDPEALIYLNNAHIGRGKSYSIAVSVPIGTNVNGAQEILRGVAQAQTAVNERGGFDGTRLKVQIIDDDNNPDIARQVATSLSQDSKILGVVGHYASDTTLATVDTYQSARLVAISPISTSVKLSNLSPYLFRTVPSDYIAARSLAEYMLDSLARKNVAVFYNSQSNYSESLKSEFVAAVSLGGGQVTNTFDLSDANFSAADSVSQAMDGGAEAIMLAANTDTLDEALQVTLVNRQRLALLAGDGVYGTKTLQVAGKSAENMVLAIPWHIKANLDGEFAKVSQKLWQGEVNWRTAMAYDATMALIAAIERNPNPTRTDIQKTLAEPNFVASGASKQINFLPSGDRPKQIELVKVRLNSGSSFDYQFVPVADK